MMFPTKSPGIYGMLALFYQKYGDLVGDEVVAFCLNVLNGGASVKDINETLITLIPKEFQSAFVPSGLMIDNIVAAFESIHAIRRRGQNQLKKMVLKLEMSKAYHRVE
ncbi:hypothetical protein L3X38_011133 [Prunus dulcis]|uniref:Uncharacterized protein n=1 Tax=Prunus dulcis TaxID=3755 RepID=A0AAD4WJ38_PRUDU|nr:hypothetical protein L3X38_011133 [Prunus dulcis]